MAQQKIEDDVHKRLKQFCKKNGVKQKYAASRAIEDYLDERPNGLPETQSTGDSDE